jgi:prepilin-type processing-associated H-X9-DG protein
MIQFETSMGAFPSGGWGNLWLPSPNRGGELKQTGGWTFTILPSLEQQPLRDLIERADAANAATTYESALSTPIPAFACPSRRSSEAVPTRSVTFKASPSTSLPISTAARADYAANGGSGAACPPLYVLRGVTGTMSVPFCHDPTGSTKQSLSLDVTSILVGGHVRDLDDHLRACDTCNRVVVDDDDNPDNVTVGDTMARQSASQKLQRHDPSAYIPDFQDGIVHRMSRIVPAKVMDGLSNTYLLAEKYVPREGYAGTETGDDPLLAGYGSHNVRWAYDRPANDRDDDVTQTGRRANAMGSAHAGTFTVAYADGSVQDVSTSIDITVHRRLASRADGQTVERP